MLAAVIVVVLALLSLTVAAGLPERIGRAEQWMWRSVQVGFRKMF